MTRSGSGGVDTSCTFTEIKKIPNGIEAIEFCTLGDNGVVWVEKSTYQIIGRRLRIKQIFTSEKAKNETGCVTVGPTPDGFLNLRVGPGMMFTVKAKLNMGDLLRIDAKNDEWTHVTGVVEDSWVKTDGWVYTKYVKEGASCHFP